MPSFMKEEPPADYKGNWQFNSAAWKRRFLTIEMTEQIDIDSVKVIWKHNSASSAAAKTFVKICYDQIKSKILQEKLKMYGDFVEDKIESDWIELKNKCAESVTDWVNKIVTSVSKPTAFSEIMKNEEKKTKKLKT